MKIHCKKGFRYADKDAVDDIRLSTYGSCIMILRERVRRSRHYKPDYWRGLKARMPDIYTNPA